MPSNGSDDISALVVDVSPLWELQYTGISNVVRELASRFLTKQLPYNVHFSVFHRLVPHSAIEEAVAKASGEAIRNLFKRDQSLPKTSEWQSANRGAKTAGLFLHVKPPERTFDYEAQLYYDFSFLSVPECHTEETIAFHTRDLQEQVDTTDHFFTISESAAKDLSFYFGISEARIDVAHLGVHLDASVSRTVRDAIAQKSVEPYLLCLGTIEPRKNVRLILAWLARNRAVMDHYRFVFIGRDGWGQTFNHLLVEYELGDFRDRGRIAHLGYVTDAQKTALICAARGLLFPSLFEGFGLPVLEAMAVGTPVVSSCSTSLPEVLGPDGIYFDPYSIESFEEAMRTLIFEDITGTGVRRSTLLKERSGNFSYDLCFEVISSRLQMQFSSNRTAVSKKGRSRPRARKYSMETA